MSRADQELERRHAEEGLVGADPRYRTFGTYATTPIVVAGTVYTQDINSNVYSINLKTARSTGSRSTTRRRSAPTA